MAHFQLIKKQFLKTDLETIWDFASSPKNLKEITPDYMLFDITSKDLPEKMYPWNDYHIQGVAIFEYKNELGNRNHSG
jgi:ligand-binding SRPBCC domain-containing protein